jgi:hypothetical protein
MSQARWSNQGITTWPSISGGLSFALTLQGRRSTFVTKIRMQTNIGNCTTLLKPRNIGTHLKGIEISFQVVPLFLKSFHCWVSYITFWNFLKIPSAFKGLIHYCCSAAICTSWMGPKGSTVLILTSKCTRPRFGGTRTAWVGIKYGTWRVWNYLCHRGRRIWMQCIYFGGF